MLEFVERVSWEPYLAFLEQGSPSIGMQLAIVNAALVGFWLLRRVRPRTKTRPNEWLLPVMFTACNLAILTLGDRVTI